MSINWYPGHMAKTNRILSEQLKNVDVVCEMVDARIPVASRNPQLNSMVKNKRKIMILNREDLADPNATEGWLRFYRSQGYTAIKTNCKNGEFRDDFITAIRESCQDLLQKNADKGQVGKAVRAMVIGIPNIGKSSFINRLFGRKAAVAEDRPGVTRTVKWFALNNGTEILDTPGMLWKKIDSDEVGYMLAFTGTIKDEILDREDLACRLIDVLEKEAPGAIEARYGTAPRKDGEIAYDVLCNMGRKRGFLVSGGEVNTERMAIAFLSDFREGKLGRITLEKPPVC